MAIFNCAHMPTDSYPFRNPGDKATGAESRRTGQVDRRSQARSYLCPPKTRVLALVMRRGFLARNPALPTQAVRFRFGGCASALAFCAWIAGRRPT
jgi:hypothetical protein